MCVKIKEDIVAALILKWFGKCLIKCDFTAEIQPQKMDSGTVSVIWIKKTRKSDIYHIY